MPCSRLAVALPGAAAFAQTPAVQSSTPPAAPQEKLPRVSARVLRPGAKGTQVRGLQTLLRAVGLTVDVDGKYAYKTSRAVQRFQVAARLQASGIAGPETAQRAAPRRPRPALR